MIEPENKLDQNTKLTPAQENEKAIQEKLQDAGEMQQEKNYTQTTPEQGSDVPPQEQTVGIP
ncbi:hypothetical protein [Pontibacter arcticus]|uniref:Uncharacterized protein n=1 Tax=Pontibacter arcticus TaxID=2080288 RepID=A0A364RGW1_9BACT|nr:hypothetical protein [Pontibacter arcticus]RAU83426.1 hypothetical protein DP923_09510 [Pontibacter arcticus]